VSIEKEETSFINFSLSSLWLNGTYSDRFANVLASTIREIGIQSLGLMAPLLESMHS